MTRKTEVLPDFRWHKTKLVAWGFLAAGLMVAALFIVGAPA